MRRRLHWSFWLRDVHGCGMGWAWELADDWVQNVDYDGFADGEELTR